MVEKLLFDLSKYCLDQSLEILLTLNLPEDLPFNADEFSFPVRVQTNANPKGFGANHNQAFKSAQGEYFCIVNPDIRFDVNPFPSLLKSFEGDSVGVAAPVVVGASGDLEDSIRRFPTPKIIILKAFGQRKVHDYKFESETLYPDWVGGMFMLFQHHVFEEFNGFDERYFLYYEDVDLCARLNLAGLRVVACNRSIVVHHAQRSSHKNLKYLRWHLTSMLRYFLSPIFWRLKRLRRL